MTQVKVPGLGESVSEAILIKWHKSDGQAVAMDEPICELETDKANVDVPAPAAGVFTRGKDIGAKVRIGETIATIDPNGKATTAPVRVAPKAAAQAATPTTGGGPELSPAVRRMVEENSLEASSIKASGPGGRITKEDVLKHLEARSEPQKSPAHDVDPAEARALVAPAPPSADGVRRQPMSKIRKRIAENLVHAQQTAAILTTFNEVDLLAISDLRTRYKENFEKKHGISLGFMSFFARAVCMALKEYERVNAFLDGDDIVFHDFVHLGIAVSTDRGLAVPVLRNAHAMSFATIEKEIKRLAAATRDGKLGVTELSGGTFTITNGGVFGSLMATPILNPPQSGILGMHAIKKRPIVVDDQIVIRPMMYIALSYDHRIIDGRESVSFLVRVKELLEDPTRLMLEV